MVPVIKVFDELRSLCISYRNAWSSMTSVQFDKYKEKFIRENNVKIYYGLISFNNPVVIADAVTVSDVSEEDPLIKKFLLIEKKTRQFIVSVFSENSEKHYSYSMNFTTTDVNAEKLNRGDLLLIGGPCRFTYNLDDDCFSVYESERCSLEFSSVEF